MPDNCKIEYDAEHSIVAADNTRKKYTIKYFAAALNQNMDIITLLHVYNLL